MNRTEAGVHAMMILYDLNSSQQKVLVELCFEVSFNWKIYNFHQMDQQQKEGRGKLAVNEVFSIAAIIWVY